ncbi:YtxH domain-containing protein [Aequorivita sp. H23M31]|uniref:YtxH domain-containing protein n=1 Tax=Aequorivita ciconiae TaxID=2494375 RepID=A0A410G177_9FLAO|nr:YtxH domain-containing protein [Aequorivita sp. H23M31]QAA80999.1 YtxH domain-containing protein [Aequorivita sp. H23M31]
MSTKRTGLLALIGIAAGAFAFWKYKNMTPEEKEKIKSKVSDTGRRIKETVGDVESTISDKYDSLKNKAKQEYKDVTP